MRELPTPTKKGVVNGDNYLTLTHFYVSQLFKYSLKIFSNNSRKDNKITGFLKSRALPKRSICYLTAPESAS